jgi:predicted metalloendopeptidase
MTIFRKHIYSHQSEGPMRYFLSTALAVMLISACQTAEPDLDLGIDVAAMDTTVRPQDDLFRYVNGTWLRTTEIPPDKPYAGSFVDLLDTSEVHLKNIIEEAAAVTDAAPGSSSRKVGDMYRSFMDSMRVEELGLSPLDEEFQRIDEIATSNDVVRYMAHAEVSGITDPFSMWVDQDLNDATRYIVYFSQSGIGLPDRDYYFDEQFAEVRSQYMDYIKTMFELAGFDNGLESARAILDLETRLAEHHWTRVRNRDREATYNKYSIADAAELSPSFDWDYYLDAIGGGEVDSIVIRQPDYFAAFSDIAEEVPVEDWKTYFRLRLLSNSAPYLPARFVDASFDFYGRTLNGQQEQRPRWKRAVSATDGTLGEMVGELYVNRYFPPEAKVRMDELVSNLRRAFKHAIKDLEWMTDETKLEAQDKLSKFTTKIGYPERWKDYSKLEIRSDDLLGNMRRSTRMEHFREMDKLGKPIDRGEWFMTPQTVNAYYKASMNEIVFPAAILRPPMFNLQADDAVNYGAIGAVIGHEMSHGFDDQGRKSDGDGNLRDWWSEKDEEEFKKRTQVLVEQYNQYSPIEGMNVNGELTLGENIGDLAGLTMAYKAYLLSLGGREAPVIDGYTGDQRFFLGYAQAWRLKLSEQLARRFLVVDTHSPAEYRCNGVVVNMPEFVAAFDVQEGDGMYRAPDDQVKIW